MRKIIQGILLLLLFTSTASSFAEEIKISAIVPEPIGGSPKTGANPTSYIYYDGVNYLSYTPKSGEDMGTIGAPPRLRPALSR